MFRKWGAVLLLVLSFAMAWPRAAGQQTSADSEGHQWWQDAVFYEIYPRSFADSNNDGIGDLNGISSKLDYLKEVGVDAIWIAPCFPSPQVDFGYDVSDYENIDPRYGTLADFDAMRKRASDRNIRIILDFVVNHTSDQHKWFLDSRSSRESAHRDWYIWRDGKAPGQPPNNWLSEFGHSSWQYDAATEQYYYHNFYPQQPDLNWRNPAVKDAMFDVARWWYKRGVAGFRLDAVNTLFEDPALHDNPILPGLNRYGDPAMEYKYNAHFPEVHDVLRGLRTVSDQYGAVLVGETWTKGIGDLKEYYGEHNNELQMPMDLLFTSVQKISAMEFREQIDAVDASGGWPVYVITNHDMLRSYNRWGDGIHNDQIAKMMAGLYLTLRGTPIMYYGEEIGMENNDPQRKEDVQDPIGKLGWPQEKGRDGERTPMQWSGGANGGFSEAKPWLPVPSSSATHNVAAETKDPNSILNFYKSVLALRHRERAFRDGAYIPLNEDDPNVISYLRRYRDETILVAVNMSGERQKIELNLADQGYSKPMAATLLTDSSNAPKAGELKEMSLDAYSVYIGRISK